MSATSAHPLVRLVRYARRERARIRWACAFSILNKVFALAPPLVIGAAVDVGPRKTAGILAARFSPVKHWVCCC